MCTYIYILYRRKLILSALCCDIQRDGTIENSELFSDQQLAECICKRKYKQSRLPFARKKKICQVNENKILFRFIFPPILRNNDTFSN